MLKLQPEEVCVLGSMTDKYGRLKAEFVTRTYGPVLRRRGCVIGSGLVLHGRPVVSLSAGSTLVMGSNVTLSSLTTHTALGAAHAVVLRTVRHDARLGIGDDCGLSGTSIVAARSVELGSRCLVGADAMIFDTPFHPVDAPGGRRWAPLPAPSDADEVLIEDDVFIGTRAIVLPGTHIGRNSVVAAGAVVRGSFPSDVLIAGNPAQIVRRLRKRSESTESTVGDARDA